MSSDINAIRLFTVLLDKGFSLRLLSYFSPSTILAIASEHGLITVSPILLGFFCLAILLAFILKFRMLFFKVIAQFTWSQ